MKSTNRRSYPVIQNSRRVEEAVFLNDTCAKDFCDISYDYLLVLSNGIHPYIIASRVYCRQVTFEEEQELDNVKMALRCSDMQRRPIVEICGRERYIKCLHFIYVLLVPVGRGVEQTHLIVSQIQLPDWSHSLRHAQLCIALYQKLIDWGASVADVIEGCASPSIYIVRIHPL